MLAATVPTAFALWAIAVRAVAPSGPVIAQPPARTAGTATAVAMTLDPGSAQTAGSTEFQTGRASFSVKVRNDVSPYRVLGLFVLPDERVTIRVVTEGNGSRYRLTTSAEPASPDGERQWTWRAPTRPGLYSIRVLQDDPPDSITLNAFVLVPVSEVKEGHLNGYRIGEYPAVPLRGLSIYQRPRGFIEVTPENRNTLIAPHFTVGQFLCKQASGWPKYVVLKERLLLKLELILEKTNEAGYRTDSFVIMSGYRTPYYNRAIGNVRYSRHVWGDAADIFIDVRPRDGMMDDLNADGRIDYQDAHVLYELIDDLYGEPWYTPFVGGLGRYRRTSSHGPFVHVDARGFRARWGV